MSMASRKEIKKNIMEVQNEPFEHYYPHEKEKSYGEAYELASRLGDDRLKNVIMLLD